MTLLLLACQRSPAPEAAGALRFPHAEGYGEGTAHGAEARRLGSDLCLGCHRDEVRKNAGAPACTTCHESFPHPDGWLAGSVHGVGLAGAAGGAARDACASCHGVEGLEAPSCGTCHGSYPHPADWETAGTHGAWATARGSLATACGSCHGADLGGGPNAPSCTSCHASFPHPTGWADPALHATADLGTCAGCHGEGGTGGTSGVACSRCHANYPHADGWAAGHIAVAGTVGEAVCLDCHDAGDGPVGVPAGCGRSCHGGLP